MSAHLVFGPVPSRRLGQSLGINNIPPKICTYACIYCQLGRTIRLRYRRSAYYSPEEIEQHVRQRLQFLRGENTRVDYLTFVPDGEPTLDLRLNESIERLKPFHLPIAVITNASLLYLPDVQEALLKADLISLKIDAVDESIWRRIDRPHARISFPQYLESIRQFARRYSGHLITETMLVREVNTAEAQLQALAEFIAQLKPETAYLAIPTRPPAEEFVLPPSEEMLNRAFQIYSRQIPQTEYLIGYEGNRFASTGDVREDLLSITAVHPMRRDAVLQLLQKAGASFQVVEELIQQGELKEAEYQGETFYLRKFSRN
jgi:wyosine [tRNA(Phe)-imidazoG37] synthetase (radical SAM superfamily)